MRSQTKSRLNYRRQPISGLGKKTIWDDVDFTTALNPDYLQFMQLGPMPGTTLYKDYERKEKLIKDLPYADESSFGAKFG